MKRRNLILALAAAGLVAAAVLWPRGREVEVVSVTRAALTQSVVATGRIATPARIVIGSPLAATVLEVTVREGDPVRPGQLLARLRADDAEALVSQAAAALAEAEARFVQIESVGRPVAAQQLAQAEANRKVALAEAERARQLVAKGFYAQSKADDALRNAANAASAADTARAQLAAQQAGGSEREAARARVDQARAQLVNARARAAQLTLTAPAAGVVLTRKAEPGDVATAGKVLLELAEAGETRVYATVDEKNLSLLKPGQKARGVADAFPAQPFDAELYYLAPAVDPQRGTVETRFRVPAAPPFLRPDMTVSVETITGHRDATLVLPAEAVRDPDSGKPWVLVARDGIATRAEVGLGLSGIGRVEILTGLAEGDQVLLPAGGALEGDRLRIREARKPKVSGVQVPQGMTR
ncbi:MAG: efflux RND transporter periplasmic adaptor subunit [Zoogloea sp.]|uniref:efflux RND transporter periplasmic adaptor subunit n=1 Tax=Zoogloea sp. TaxID=49181 RepID=UPI002616D147|nr:efflux RND transporter periplasmic adaptor subunit [Zoogloea sp.]MDD2988200.1 efflux RND transporter periplasmic adaptor subunit [Zoogloea sp.]